LQVPGEYRRLDWPGAGALLCHFRLDGLERVVAPTAASRASMPPKMMILDIS